MKEKIITVITISVLFLGMMGIIPQYLYDHYVKESSRADEIHINWEEKYPFTEKEAEGRKIKSPLIRKILEYKQDSLLSTYRVLVRKAESKFNEYFPFRIKIVEANGAILKSLGIKKISGSDTIVDLGDGYLTLLVQTKKDVSHAANEVSEFAAWLEQQNIGFLYVQAPFKIEKNSSELSGYTDYSNENADNFLMALKKNVITMDLRDDIQNEFDQYKELFYKTDHHWLPETGLWASKKIAEQLNVNFGYEINLDLYSRDRYATETYENWLLGSLGKKVTLGYCEPENLEIYYPTQPTKLHVKVPTLNIDTTGSFYDSLIYKRVLKTKKYYDWDAYWAYGYGDRALIEIDNLEIEKGKKVLMIKDSFADTVYPFLSLGLNELSVIDMRHFTGSLRTYIKDNKPDLVIFLCSPSSLPNGKIERSSHNSIFDLQ